MRPNQDDATVKEFLEAYEDGHLASAWAIYRANPDLVRRFEHVLLGCPKTKNIGEPGHTTCWFNTKFRSRYENLKRTRNLPA